MQATKNELEQYHIHNHLDTDRIEALGDHIFGIVMTLLAIELIFPELLIQNPSTDLIIRITGILPRLLGYFLTFIVLGVLLKSIMMIMYSTISFTLAALVKTLQDLQIYKGTFVPEILFELFFIGGLVFLFLALRTIIAVMDNKTSGAV